MAKLFLVRHGEPAENWGGGNDPGLSRFGRTQVEHCAQRLADLGALKIISSPTKRARESAEPAAKLQRQNVVLDPRVGEVPPPAGVSDVRTWMRENFSAESVKTWSSMDQRMLAWREGLLAAVHEIKTDTAIVTHYVAINVVVGAALRREETAVCRPDFASITELSVAADGELRMVFYTDPLGEGQPG
jgi:broad specificity phosphatase PhoE